MRRRGVILIVVLACLVVAGMVSLSVARQTLLARRAVDASQSRLQAEWLAEAGLERAAARLAAEPGYTGETWRIQASELDGIHDAEVQITARPVSGRTGRWSVEIRADYPRDLPLRCRRVKQFEIDRNRLHTGETS